MNELMVKVIFSHRNMLREAGKEDQFWFIAKSYLPPPNDDGESEFQLFERMKELPRKTLIKFMRALQKNLINLIKTTPNGKSKKKGNV